MIELRDYQIDIANKAAKTLKELKISYLAMEVRTGKTLTALKAADIYGAKNVLFVTKLKAIKSIQSDYDLLSPAFEITLINFESVHKATGAFDLVIVDEAHSLGAFPKPSKRTIELKQIAKGLPIIFLSGTPTPESYSQMYHQLFVSSFSPWRQYPSFYKWSFDGFVDIKEKYINGFKLRDYSSANEIRIKGDLSPFLLTFSQQQANFNQTIKETTLTVKMNDIVSSTIKQLSKDKVAILNGQTVLADTPAKLLGKLHQISTGTCIDEEGHYHIIDRSKAEFIRDHFKGQHIAVFYVYKSEFEMLKEVFPNWTASPEEFQEYPDKTFLGCFRSAREGTRLDTADALVFMNLEYSFLSYEQAKNRLQSKERLTPARLYFVFSDCGIERFIYQAVCNKKDFTLKYFYHGKDTAKAA